MTIEPRSERTPNWLPLPCAADAPKEQQVDENDLFPKAEVVSFYAQQGFGSIRNARGDLLPFRLSGLDVAAAGRGGLAVGRRVGYDASWTSGGMRVSRIKVY